jgi:hypothetical protein
MNAQSRLLTCKIPHDLCVRACQLYLTVECDYPIAELRESVGQDVDLTLFDGGGVPWSPSGSVGMKRRPGGHLVFSLESLGDEQTSERPVRSTAQILKCKQLYHTSLTKYMHAAL